MSNSTKHFVPSYVATVIGLSSETLSGQAYLNGGGGLHVAFGGHSLLIAAMQLPSLALNTVHRVSCDCAGGGFVGCAGGGFCVGGGGFAITTGGFCCGGGCDGCEGCVVGGGGFAITGPGGCGCGSAVCTGGGCEGGGPCGPGDDCT